MSSPFIPVIHSLPSGKALVERVLCHYPIATQKCKIYKRGLNDTYLVEAEQNHPYILRVYRHGWRTLDAINFELELLHYLHSCNLPVAYPIAKTTGEFTEAIASPEGQRYAAVFSYAPGQAIGKNINSEQSQQLGEVVASIHQATDNFTSRFSRPELDCAYLLDWAMAAISLLFQHRNSDINYFLKLSAQIKAQLVNLALPQTSPSYGICIGDVHSENAHFVGNQPTLFDFDQCGYGWRSFDIAKFIHTIHRWQLDANITKSFMQGYQKIRQLSQAEVNAIPIFIQVAHIWVMGIACAVVEEVLPYGEFTEEWFDSKLALLSKLT
jgi:Ser/Thr protein kinase RdoA (MazF antagonist)